MVFSIFSDELWPSKNLLLFYYYSFAWWIKDKLMDYMFRVSSQWTQIEIQNKIYAGIMKPTPSSNADDIDKITVEIIWQYIANTIKSSLIL